MTDLKREDFKREIYIKKQGDEEIEVCLVDLKG